MKRLFAVIIAAVVAFGVAEAKSWCESLVNSLNETSGVDKSVAVTRDPKTHEITKATYDFKFSSGKLYDQILNTMKNHAIDADYYSETGEKNKVILMRVSDNGRLWSCKLQKLSRNSKQFLVTVNSGDEKSTVTIVSPSQQREIQRKTQEAVREAQKAARKAQREAWEAQKKAQREAWETQRKAWQETMEAQRKARQEALEAQQKARRESWEQQRKAQQESWKSRGRSGHQTIRINNTPTADQKSAINAHNQELQNADAERKRKLAQ